MNSDWGISYEIALRWVSLDLTDDKSTLGQVMAWCRQATTITWANFDPDQCRHMASLGHNELMSNMLGQNQDISLHMTSSPNEFSWGCEFADGMSIMTDLQYDLFQKLDDVSASFMRTRHLISIIACWWPFCHAITSTKCPRALGTLTRPWNVYPSDSAFFNYFLSNHSCSLATIMSYQRKNEKLSNDVYC